MNVSGTLVRLIWGEAPQECVVSRWENMDVVTLSLRGAKARRARRALRRWQRRQVAEAAWAAGRRTRLERRKSWIAYCASDAPRRRWWHVVAEASP